jgi:K+ transporter
VRSVLLESPAFRDIVGEALGARYGRVVDASELSERLFDNTKLAFYVATSRLAVDAKRGFLHRVVSDMFAAISRLQAPPAEYLQLPVNCTIDIGSGVEL